MVIERVTCRIGRRTILYELSAECPEGGVTVLVGPNGAGKTTLLRCLSGDLPPDPGVITFRGRQVDLASPGWQRIVGVVPDSDALFGELTVEEQMELTATLFGVRNDDQRERVASLIEVFGLSDHRDAFAKELSSGLRKRLSIALSLIHAPELFLLDEPLNSLDYAGGETLFELLRFLRTIGHTVVVSGHSIAALLLVADRVIEMAQGRIVNSVDIDENTRSLERIRPLLKTIPEAPAQNSVSKFTLPWLTG